MVERYHELDDSVLREILGKKVTSKTRKDLDDASELTSVPLRSCHRQYDNIQRWVHMSVGQTAGLFRRDAAGPSSDAATTSKGLVSAPWGSVVAAHSCIPPAPRSRACQYAPPAHTRVLNERDCRRYSSN